MLSAGVPVPNIVCEMSVAISLGFCKATVGDLVTKKEIL